MSAVQNILLGDCDYGVGDGVEVMSRGACLSTAKRSDARMGDTILTDMMVETSEFTLISWEAMNSPTNRSGSDDGNDVFDTR